MSCLIYAEFADIYIYIITRNTAIANRSHISGSS